MFIFIYLVEYDKLSYFRRRLDYFVISERLMDSVCDNVMRTEIYGSDHCPIVLYLSIP